MNKINIYKAGQELFFSGIIYVARDQAHKRLVEAIMNKNRLPFPLKGAIVYYCGPTKTPKNKIIGACGPTTSSRMDAFTPTLLQSGLMGMIGKGNRSSQVRAAIKKYKGIYFITYAGCGALLSKHIESVKIIAYRDLGPEAILKLTVKDFPLIVAIDAKGGSIYG